jgi:hypothetical protein
MIQRSAISSVDERMAISPDSEALSPLAFEPYRNELAALLSDYRQNRSANADKIIAALDGQPGRELRRRYNLDLLRATGTFFTGSDLASRMTKHLRYRERK